MKCNSCKNLISGRDHVEEMLEIDSCFQGIIRGSLLRMLFSIMIKLLIN